MGFSEERIAKEEIARLTGNLDDSRPREERGVIRTPLGNATPVFCVSCAKAGGYAYVNTDSIIYVCDDCTAKHGGLPLPVADEDYVRGRKDQGGPCRSTTT